jgi:hypothetical protein
MTKNGLAHETPDSPLSWIDHPQWRIRSPNLGLKQRRVLYWHWVLDRRCGLRFDFGFANHIDHIYRNVWQRISPDYRDGVRNAAKSGHRRYLCRQR